MLPATWSNVGFGLFGKWYSDNWTFGYEAYLTNGFDDIGLTLFKQDKIKAFEARRLAEKPWLAHTLVR